MSFSLENILIPVYKGCDTVDVQIEGEGITACAPQLEITLTVIDGAES